MNIYSSFSILLDKSTVESGSIKEEGRKSFGMDFDGRRNTIV